ncbi:hypothetical protein KIW84_061227 [Lathyrus oleraceus]|uniref:Uncharacterized protein n=1 Tax=Pisum sativum TaxID=3888 RepID=A0A9D4W1U4_PEA|nr:hypothetical protein KIW84_061227 [Pisum sativum]
MESRSGAAKKRKGATTSRTVPIQFDQDKFVGPKQAARYISLEKRKILPEKRFLINPQGTNRNFAGLIDAKKWDRLINPLEHYDIATVREFYANALPDDDEPFTWLGAEERDQYHTDLRLHRDVEAISAALLLPGKSVELNPSGVPMSLNPTPLQCRSQWHIWSILLTNVQIDVARIIANELKSVIESGLKSGARVNCPLAFPCLIMSLCIQARVRLPSRGQVRIPSPIDDRYVAKYCRAKNARGSAASGSTRASDGPGTSTPRLDPYVQAVCNYSLEWMAASQRAMLDMHDSMQRLQLQGSVYSEGVGAAVDEDDDDDDDDVDDEGTGSDAGSEEES